MDDLYGNAWGDPVNDYPSNPLPTWDARPPSPKPPSPVGDDENDNYANDDDSEDTKAEPQSRTDDPDASWTTDAVPWPAEKSQSQYYAAWAPVPPVDVWSSPAQPQAPAVPTQAPAVPTQAPAVPTQAPSDDAPSKSPPPTPPTLTKEEHKPLEQPQDTPIQSRVPSPDQFGTFESGDADAIISADEVGWGPPKYSIFDDSVHSSNAWGQQATTEERDTEAEPVDEWEAARRMREKLDRRVVRICSYSSVSMIS